MPPVSQAQRKAMEAERAKQQAAQKAEADRLAAIQKQIDDARKAQEAEAKRLAELVWNSLSARR